jgi:type I restriction enzyme S subunit
MGRMNLLMDDNPARWAGLRDIGPLAQPLEFARRVTAVETLKRTRRASLAELDALFASLQHRAFRGEL